jgi:folate-binding protein YgfZ
VLNRYPWFGVDFDETNLPQELDRDARTIDFKKGCYLGQETIARLDAMGQVQKKLMLWKFPADKLPQPGTEIKQGEKLVGQVTSATYDFQQETSLALVMTRRSHFAEGATAETDLGIATVKGGERNEKG